MTLQQTVTIPADRRLVIEVPETWTAGSVRFVIFPVEEEASAQTGAQETAPAAWTLPPKPKNAPSGYNFWQDRVRPMDDPLAWLDAHGPFDGPSVDEFMAERHAENEREEAKMDAMFNQKREWPK